MNEHCWYKKSKRSESFPLAPQSAKPPNTRNPSNNPQASLFIEGRKVQQRKAMRKRLEGKPQPPNCTHFHQSWKTYNSRFICWAAERADTGQARSGQDYGKGLEYSREQYSTVQTPSLTSLTWKPTRRDEGTSMELNTNWPLSPRNKINHCNRKSGETAPHMVT